ncbi:MAG TPA: LysR substrate-binding domain-containing protein [Steroidobacter sp.]|uniref:LysR substrate-binding domain-containing protein n=1 Tax=Steroidobacter sp. TaxID=1978227 RepID=UPI002EDBB3C2
MRLTPSLITWLRCMEATARHGSCTRAAAELHLTQGAVSQQIRQLERTLECKLFNRRPNRMELTRAGRRLQAEIGPALQRIEQAIASVRMSRGPFLLSCAPSFASRWLMQRLGSFLRLHTEFDLRLAAEYHALNQERFLDDGLHAAIRYDAVDYTDLRAEVLMDEYILPVASPEFLARNRRLARSFDLSAVTLLHDGAVWDGAPESTEWDTYLQSLRSKRPRNQKNRYFNTADLVIAAARSGEGVAVARLALVLDDIVAGRLAPVVNAPLRAPCRYVFLSGTGDSPQVETFVRWLREQCRQFSIERDKFIERLMKR